MARITLEDAFNDCIDRLHDGQSVNDCLRLYPMYARQLVPMLQAIQTTRRAMPISTEIAEAQSRARQRFERALQAPAPRTLYPFQRLATIAAAVMIVLMTLFGGAAVAAQDSLPGDPLYGIKLLTEQIRLFLSGDDAALQQEFANRRIDETRTLLIARREADVMFSGRVDGVSDDTALVAGLPLQFNAGTPGIELLETGAQVEVDARTTADGELVAIAIRPANVSQTRPSITDVPPTLTDTPTATNTATATRTHTPTSTASPTPTATTTLMLPDATETPAGCVVDPPDGWILYHVQAGDSLSALAARAGTSLERVMVVNCIRDPALIVIGQPIYLPRPPAVTPTSTPEVTRPPTQQGIDNPTEPSRPPTEATNARGGDGGNDGGGRGGRGE